MAGQQIQEQWTAEAYLAAQQRLRQRQAGTTVSTRAHQPSSARPPQRPQAVVGSNVQHRPQPLAKVQKQPVRCGAMKRSLPAEPVNTKIMRTAQAGQAPRPQQQQGAATVTMRATQAGQAPRPQQRQGTATVTIRAAQAGRTPRPQQQQGAATFTTRATQAGQAPRPQQQQGAATVTTRATQAGQAPRPQQRPQEVGVNEDFQRNYNVGGSILGIRMFMDTFPELKRHLLSGGITPEAFATVSDTVIRAMKIVLIEARIRIMDAFREEE